MKIEVNDEIIRLLYYWDILRHSSDIHKNHHVQLLDISEESCNFTCLDCDTEFKAKLIGT